MDKKKSLAALFFFVFLPLLAYLQSPKNTEVDTRQYYQKLAADLGITHDQKVKVQIIDKEYLADMNGTREYVETNYNEPKHIQYQHTMTLLRRFSALKAILQPEEYLELRRLYYDPYSERDWLHQFYKRSGLPTIEEAVKKKEKQLQRATD